MKVQTGNELTGFLAGAVQSMEKLSDSFLKPKGNENVDETLNDDWLFARSLFVRLKDIPAGRETDSFKVRT